MEKKEEHDGAVKLVLTNMGFGFTNQSVEVTFGGNLTAVSGSGAPSAVLSSVSGLQWTWSCIVGALVWTWCLV